MSETPAEAITRAAALIRERANAANTDEARRPYGDPRKGEGRGDVPVIIEELP